MSIYKKFAEETFDKQGALTSFKLKYEDNFNFAYDVVDAIAGQEPDRRALVWATPANHCQTFTFGDLKELSNKAANVLIKHGIKKGDRVMLILKRHYQYWYTLLALHKIGAVAIPATHMLSSEDLEYRIEAADVKSIIITSDTHSVERLEECDLSPLKAAFIVNGQRKGFWDFDREVAEASSELARIETNVSDPFLLYFTSGTTGNPKGVIHNYTYPLCHIITARYWQNVVDGGLHLSISDTGWGKASWGKIYGQWLCGAAVMVYDYDQFSPRKLLELIKDFKVDTFCAPPTIYHYLVRSHTVEEAFKGVSYTVSAGEPLSSETSRQFTEKTGLTIYEGYGQTETTLLVGNLIGTAPVEGSLGKASPLYDIRIMKADGTFAAADEDGEIVLLPDENGRFSGVFSGYISGSSTDSDVWRGGVYHTKDLARCDENGYFWYIGRTDDMIKSSGYRVSPSEVEDVLMTHPAVMECAVTGVSDQNRGQAVKASIVLTEEYKENPDVEQELKKFMSLNTAAYKRPKYYQFIDEMPRTISGKIRRVEFREK